MQSEDEPIGWFELEEDWNDVEIQLQQCRVAKVPVCVLLTFEPFYLMFGTFFVTSRPFCELFNIYWLCSPNVLLFLVFLVPDGEIPLHQAGLCRAAGCAEPQLQWLPVSRNREAR